MNTRVYDEKIDINTEDAKKFWTKNFIVPVNTSPIGTMENSIESM